MRHLLLITTLLLISATHAMASPIVFTSSGSFGGTVNEDGVPPPDAFLSTIQPPATASWLLVRLCQIRS
jgi:hypothetical protein